jgi:large subunit ribosomal protein L40e
MAAPERFQTAASGARPAAAASRNLLQHRTRSNGMAKFDAAERRMLDRQICMRCNARNASEAERCRKCGYTKLRPKATERRAA